jgi:hypothetical protein
MAHSGRPTFGMTRDIAAPFGSRKVIGLNSLMMTGGTKVIGFVP